jgi:hypothetical protein
MQACSALQATRDVAKTEVCPRSGQPPWTVPLLPTQKFGTYDPVLLAVALHPVENRVEQVKLVVIVI